MEHTRSLWLQLESLKARLDHLEQLKGDESHEEFWTYEIYPPGLAPESLRLRLTKLEQAVNLRYDYASSVIVDKGMRCPADNCNRPYRNARTLHQHIRQSQGIGHKFLSSIIDQTVCLSCNVDFGIPASLSSHEYRVHDLTYQTRLQMFARLMNGSTRYTSDIDPSPTSESSSTVPWSLSEAFVSCSPYSSTPQNCARAAGISPSDPLRVTDTCNSSRSRSITQPSSKYFINSFNESSGPISTYKPKNQQPNPAVAKRALGEAKSMDSKLRTKPAHYSSRAYSDIDYQAPHTVDCSIPNGAGTMM